MSLKKKRKLSRKGNYFVLIVFLIILFVVVPIGYIQIENQKYHRLGYSNESISMIRKHKLNDYVLEKGKSELLNLVLSSLEFKKENLNIYEQVSYKDQKEFTKHINLLQEKGYNAMEINHIIRTGSTEEVSSFLERDYIKNTLDYLNFDYAKLVNYDRYVAYQKENYTIPKETVIQVNIGLDNPFYDKAIIIDSFSIDVLANKYRQLGENYIPSDLTSLDEEYSLNENQQLSKEAHDAFVKLANKANDEGLVIKVRSSYRSFKQQSDLYEAYKEQYGIKKADSIAARPGFSEHQTGLVIDVGTSDTSVFATTKEFQWLKKNAQEYGYILRYPKGKEDITGYNYESWHYRYVGKEIAQYISKNGITYDEYYMMFLENK